MQPELTEEKLLIELAWHPDDSLEGWGLRFLHALRQRLPILSAALYGHIQQQTLDFVASYATEETPFRRLGWGEGLVGEVARTQRPFLGKVYANARQRYGVGEIEPAFHWIFPWVYQGETWAITEALLWRELTEAEKQWLQEESYPLAILSSSVFQQQRIHRLLKELQAQNQLLEENLKSLEEAQTALNLLNASLEQRVKERTQELEQALYHLRTTQQQLILSEKMAALGQIVAGVAHEINSPLGAIKGSAETLLDALPHFLRLFQTLTTHQPQSLVQSIDWILNEAWQKERPILTSKEERALRRRYAEQLEKAGIEEAETIARRLVEAGIFVEDISPLTPLIKEGTGTELLYHLGQLKLQLENIVIASNRTRKTVMALKTYAHRQDPTRPAPTRIEETIETILTLYQNQLKQGITVHTEYAKELPTLYLFADEIGQVWTNLIQNAIQAMQGKGELFIKVECSNSEVIVSITDTGPGIPPEILPRIFEPFFTTKAKGEGTGLGLDITRRIVEKHKGRITVESQPGRTTFSIFLPLLLSQSNWYNYEPSLERV
ncbi:MAG: ATP-binding protein [Bacteroidia bacterium]|nr:ATP-binding protein [Bacteroidia bacterium]